MKRALPALLAALLFAAPAVASPPAISLDARDTELTDVIRLLGAQAHRNVVPDGSIKPQRVTLRLHDVSFDEALHTLAEAYGLQLHRDGTVLLIGDAAAMSRRYADDSAPFAARTAVLPLLHAKPDDIKASVADALPAGTVVVADKRTSTLIVSGSRATIARARSLIAALDSAPADSAAGPRARSVRLRHVRATDAVKALKTTLPDSTLVADDRLNAVVLTGSDDAQATAAQLLAALDVPGRQVLFEVRVVDVAPQIDSSNVGVTYGGGGAGTAYGSNAQGQFPFVAVKGALAVNAQLNALVQRGHASILAQPRIATLNNKEATLLVGETYPIVTTNVQTGFPTVTNVDIGVRLRITPTIGDDGEVTAELHPEYSQITGFNNSFPIIANRKVDSTLRVHDGETIVLGGLFSDVDSDTVAKFPLLGDVPVLGSFFRNRLKSHTKDEVVFYITPHVF